MFKCKAKLILTFNNSLSGINFSTTACIKNYTSSSSIYFAPT